MSVFSPLLLSIHNKKMFNCFSTMVNVPNKQLFTAKSRHYKQVITRLTQQEIAILSLIYQDLATRISQNRLTFQNFLNFFNLTGQWGSKLFHQFDQDGQQLISFEEFLYGISQTAKAPFEQKIRLLYRFFEDKIDQGIDFQNFTKMLYNYSKDELKQILLGDQIISNQPNSALPIINKPCQHKIVQLKIPDSGKLKTKTSFDEAYQSLLDNHNEGTYLQVDTHDLTYKIKYSNMNTLIKQFAASVYHSHHIDVKNNPHAKLSYQNFSNWIQSHKKLYRSYYSAFHTDIWSWSPSKGQPSYMSSAIQFQFTGRIQCGSLRCKIYGFQVGDIIICCDSKKNKRKPIKIICLQGLNIHQVGNLGIQISHCSDCYKNSILWFENDLEHKKWLQHLKIYQRDSVHQNYITGETIGTGKFSIVYKCIQKATGKINALKVIDLNKLNQKARKAISNQSQIMKIINHFQVVKYIDTVHTKTHQYIITQYIYGQDLYEYVRKRYAFIIGNIMKAVMFLHELDIIHKDLKPENIMVMFKDKKADEIFQCTTPYIRQGQRIQNIKIIDFGLSNHISKIQKMDQSEKASGTPNYIAPQILLYGKVGPESDVFSIGSILYFLLRGRLPFASTSSQKTLLKTVKGEYDLQSQHWHKVSDNAKDLIQRLLLVDAQKRITLKQAVNHPWFAAVFNKTRQASNSNCKITNSYNNLGEEDEYPSKSNMNGQRLQKQMTLDSFNLSQYQKKRKVSINMKKNHEQAQSQCNYPNNYYY